MAEFNVYFTGYLTLSAVVAVIYLFFLNRLLAKAGSFIIRLFLPKNIFLSIDSITLAFLSGRILFKGFKYATKDYAIVSARGSYSFCLWYTSSKGLN